MDNVKTTCCNALRLKVTTVGKTTYLCFGVDFFSVGKVTLYMGDYNLEIPRYELKNIEYLG